MPGPKQAVTPGEGPPGPPARAVPGPLTPQPAGAEHGPSRASRPLAGSGASRAAAGPLRPSRRLLPAGPSAARRQQWRGSGWSPGPGRRPPPLPHLLRVAGGAGAGHVGVRVGELAVLHIALHPPRLQRHLPAATAERGDWREESSGSAAAAAHGNRLSPIGSAGGDDEGRRACRERRRTGGEGRPCAASRRHLVGGAVRWAVGVAGPAGLPLPCLVAVVVEMAGAAQMLGSEEPTTIHSRLDNHCITQ